VEESSWQLDLEQAISAANVPTLLMVLVQMTGDLRWLEPPYHPVRSSGLTDEESGGLPVAVQAEIRAAALEAILAWRRGTPVALPNPTPELLTRMLSVSMGESVPDEYGPMVAVELQGGDFDRDVPAAPPTGFSVLIIGAGVSGLCAAVLLQQAGIDYTIIEKNDRVGGTWWENRYPGCGVDTPNHLYSFSFAPHDWTRFYSLRCELEGYLEAVADGFGAHPHIRFRTEVRSASYDEAARAWTVVVDDGSGAQELRASVVISAVGGLHLPKLPDIPGLERFAGPSFHTSRWPDGLDLAGKRVGVVGTGATSMQVVPAIAGEVEHLTIFQRSPQWAAPFDKFQMPVPEPLRHLLREVPLYQRWYRIRLGWIFNDKVYPALRKDPAWTKPDRSVNAINDGHRRHFVRYMKKQLGERQDLLDDVVPDYPPFGKRMLLDNGWFRTLVRDNVTLVTEPIAEVVEDGVVTRSGEHHQLDVLVLASGFRAVQFLSGLDIRGRNGVALSDVWQGDDARAFLGLAVPGFPNFFCLYGPNTGTGHGGSYMFLAECQMRYIMSILRQMFADGIETVECRRDVYEEYNVRVDAQHAEMVWTHPKVETYYRNKRGRVVVTSPWRVVDFWHMTKHADLGDFATERL
jgi:4-hydroxyacetophenone monooxygenase